MKDHDGPKRFNIEAMAERFRGFYGDAVSQKICDLFRAKYSDCEDDWVPEYSELESILREAIGLDHKAEAGSELVFDQATSSRPIPLG